MENKILFQETQRFRQWWLWALLIIPNLLIWPGIISEINKGEMVDYGNMFIMASVNLLIIILFLSIRLETKITTDGIDFRFFPFHLKFRHYDWKNIMEKHVRKYNPLLEYGGWGIRGFGKNKAFNVSGNQGLQLVFSDGKRRLLGTRKPNELHEILESIR